VVVVPPIDVHLTRTEELAELVETVDATRALCHHEVMRDLVPGLVASSPRAITLMHKTDREASFSVYKTDHPASELDQPFLLIFRTRHVVTLDIQSDGSSSAGYTGFPAFGQIRTVSLLTRGATIRLDSCTLSNSGMSP
jgi:hypothetical protein